MERLKTESLKKLLIKYLVPSVTGSLAVGILIFIDTIFIGRGVGGMGLAALNTVLPVFTLYSSIGLMLGVGGATAASIDMGRGEGRSKNRIFSTCFIMAVILTVIFTILQQLYLDELVYGLGATEKIFPLAKSYLKVLSIFTAFYLIPHTLNIFIRNDGSPEIAMWGMIICGLVNIVLDYIFIFGMGMEMKGASLATGISQVVYFGVLLLHFFKRNNTLRVTLKVLKGEDIKRILKTGLPSFINDMSSGVAIFVFNWVLFSIAGEIYVSALSIILNINFLVYLFYIGISQGSQPIISVNFGGKLFERVKKVNKIGIGVNFSVAVGIFLISLFFSESIIRLFNNDNKELLEITSKAMPKFFSATIFMGINIYLANFFQAIEQSKVSSILIFMRGLGLLMVALIVLPPYFGTDGVWYATLIAEGITFVFVGYIYRTRFVLAKGSKKE